MNTTQFTVFLFWLLPILLATLQFVWLYKGIKNEKRLTMLSKERNELIGHITLLNERQRITPFNSRRYEGNERRIKQLKLKLKNLDSLYNNRIV